MKCGTAVVVAAIALALPAFGQHGGAHGGFSGHGDGSVGHSGFAGHAGFSGHSGFSGSRSFSGHVAAPRYGGYSRPGLPMRSGPMRSRFGAPYRGLPQHRPAYRPDFGNRRRRGWYGGVYGYAYPGWGYYPYPYVIDPGFDDWGDTGDYGYDQNPAPNDYPPYSDYGQPYPQEPYNAQPPYPQDPNAAQQPYYPQQPYTQSPYPQEPYYAPPAAPGAARVPYAAAGTEEPLTVIFNNGRAPQTMRNYMMNTQALTDMDAQHFERIPLDQIDLAATAKLNRAHGVEFEVPVPLRE